MLKIHQRGGIWHIRGTVAGRRIRASTGTRDRDTAERIRAETEARAHRQHLYGAGQETTFADAALIYQQAGKSRRYLAPLIRKIGKRRIDSITPGEIRMLAQQLYPNAKPATLNRSVVKPARAVINHAADMGLCRPIKIKRFPEQPVVRQAVDRAWIDAFRAGAIACLQPHVAQRLGTLALLMFQTGARLGEAIKLAPEHLDLAQRIAVLPAELTKTRTERVLYLTQELADEMARLPMRRTHYGRGKRRVFGWADTRGPIVPWHRACTEAGIPYRMRHEAGRHSFATEMIVRQGIDVVTTGKMGGWRDVRVLLGYAHAEGLPEVAERVFGTKLTQRNSLNSTKLRRVK